MKSLVIYHANCADGFGAAFAAWMKFGDEAEYLPMRYDQRAEWIKKKDFVGRKVYILDFSFSNGDTTEIIDEASHTVILDHHKTAFENLAKLNQEAGVSESSDSKYYMLLNNNKSGAYLAWEYFHPDTEIPMLIQHIDDYDRWQFKLGSTKAFNKALWSYAPWSFYQWQQFAGFSDAIEYHQPYQGFLNEGEAILRAHDQNVQSVAKQAQVCSIVPALISSVDSYKAPWVWYSDPEMGDTCGADGLAVNAPPHLSSDVGHELAKRSGTFGLVWYLREPGVAQLSFRSNGDYDVSAIAKAFGGGGHKNAAGAEVPIMTLLEWIK